MPYPEIPVVNAPPRNGDVHQASLNDPDSGINIALNLNGREVFALGDHRLLYLIF